MDGKSMGVELYYKLPFINSILPSLHASAYNYTFYLLWKSRKNDCNSYYDINSISVCVYCRNYDIEIIQYYLQ